MKLSYFQLETWKIFSSSSVNMNIFSSFKTLREKEKNSRQKGLGAEKLEEFDGGSLPRARKRRSGRLLRGM